MFTYAELQETIKASIIASFSVIFKGKVDHISQKNVIYKDEFYLLFKQVQKFNSEIPMYQHIKAYPVFAICPMCMIVGIWSFFYHLS